MPYTVQSGISTIAVSNASDPKPLFYNSGVAIEQGTVNVTPNVLNFDCATSGTTVTASVGTVETGARNNRTYKLNLLTGTLSGGLTDGNFYNITGLSASTFELRGATEDQGVSGKAAISLTSQTGTAELVEVGVSYSVNRTNVFTAAQQHGRNGCFTGSDFNSNEDLSASLVAIEAGSNDTDGNGMWCFFFDSAGEWVMFEMDIADFPAFRWHVFDLNVSATHNTYVTKSAGTLNTASIAGVLTYIFPNGASSAVTIGLSATVYKLDTAVLTGSGTLSEALDALIAVSPANAQPLAGVYGVAQPIEFGDGGTNITTLTAGNATAVFFAKANGTTAFQYNYDKQGITYNLGASDSIELDGYTIRSDSAFDFDCTTATAPTASSAVGFTLINADLTLDTDINLDSGTYINLQSTTANSATIDTSVFDGCSPLPSGVVTGQAATIRNATNGVFVDSGNTSPTVDFSNITFSANTNDIEVRDTTGTVTIIVAVGQTPTTTTAGATVVVRNPDVFFNAPNLADGTLYNISHRQIFNVEASAINTTTNEITLTTDTNGDAPDFDVSTAGRHTLCRVGLAVGATIPTSTEQIIDSAFYRVASISGSVITLEVVEGGGAINFTTAGTNNGSGELLTLIFDTQIAEGTVAGGSGLSQAVLLPNNAIYRFRCIHQEVEGGTNHRHSSRFIDIFGIWSNTVGGLFSDAVDAGDPTLNTYWIEIARITDITSFVLNTPVRDSTGTLISEIDPVFDGANIGGLTYSLEGRGFVQINAGAVTKDAVSVNGLLLHLDLAMWIAYQLFNLNNIWISNSQTLTIEGLFKLTIDNLEIEETAGNIIRIAGGVIEEKDGNTPVAETSVGQVILNISSQGNVGVIETAGGGGLTASAIADAVLDEALAGHVTAGTLGKAIADIEVDTNDLQTNQGNWLTATGFATPTNVTNAQTAIIAEVNDNEVVLGNIDSKVFSILLDTGTTIPNQIATLNDLSTADIDARLAAYGLPTLTQLTAAFTEIKGAGWVTETLKNIRDNLGTGGTTPADVYTYFTDAAREDAFKATGFATPTNVTNAQTAIIAEVNANETKLDIIDTNVDAILLDTGTTIPGQITSLNDLSTADIDARLAAYGLPTLTQLTAAFTEIKGAGWVTETLKNIRDNLGTGGTTPADVYTYFTAAAREDAFKADLTGLAQQSDLTLALDNARAANQQTKQL